MAQDVGTVYVQVEPSGRGFGKKIEGQIADSTEAGSKRGGSSILSRIGGAFSKVGKVGLGAIGTVAGGIAGLAAKGGFSRALNIENAQAKLKGLGHSAASVSEIMKDALASVKGTAYGLGDAATVAASLSASGVKEGAQLTNALRTVADTATISGKSLTDVGAIFGSVAARGKLQGDDMLQLTSAGVPVLQMLATHLHTTSSAVSQMVSKGQIDFQTFAAAMREGMGGAALQSGNTFTGALENVKAALSRLGQAAATPALDSLREVFQAMIPAVDKLTGEIQPLVSNAFAKLKPYADSVSKALGGFADSADASGNAAALLAGDAAKITAGFGVLAALAPKNLGKLTGALSGLGKSGDAALTDLASTFKNLGPRLSESAGSGLLKLKAVFNSDIREALAVDGDPFANALTTIAQGGSRLSAQFSGIMGRLGGTKIGGALAGLSSQLSEAFGDLSGMLASSASALSGKLGGAFGSLAAPLQGLLGKLTGPLAPIASAVGEKLSGIGSAIGTQMQGIMQILEPMGGEIRSLLSRAFNPSNFASLMGFSAIAAAVIAGLGLIDSSANGALTATIASLSAQIPGWIAQLTNQVVASLQTAMPAGAAALEGIINMLAGMLPNLTVLVQQAVTVLTDGLTAALPGLFSSIVTLLTTMLTTWAPTMITLFAQTGVSLLNGLITGIMSVIPQLAASMPAIVSSLLGSLLGLIPLLVNGGAQMLNAISNGLVSAIPALAAQVPNIIATAVSVLAANLPRIVQSGVNLILSLVNGLVSAIPRLIAALPAIITGIVGGLASNLPRIITAGIQIIVALASGLVQAVPRLLAAIPGIARGIIDGFKNVDWGQVGTQIVSGIANGLKAAAQGLWNAAKDMASHAVQSVKNALGIHSPSRVFRDEVGRWIPAGIAVGISRNGRTVATSLNALGDSMVAQGLPGITFPVSAALAETTGGAALSEAGMERAMRNALTVMPAYISDYTPTVGSREFGRMVRHALA